MLHLLAHMVPVSDTQRAFFNQREWNRLCGGCMFSYYYQKKQHPESKCLNWL